jgi:DNA-binding transcriptional ArsR family regulator
MEERILEMPPVLFDPKSIEIVKSLKEGPKLPEELCQKLPYDESTIVGTLMALHAYGILERRRSGFKGLYSVSKERLKTYCSLLEKSSKQWESLLQEL